MTGIRNFIVVLHRSASWHLRILFMLHGRPCSTDNGRYGSPLAHGECDRSGNSRFSDREGGGRPAEFVQALARPIARLRQRGF